MGIKNLIYKAKEGVSKAINKVGGAMGDAVAKTSALSPAQLKEINDKKIEYLEEFKEHDMNSDEANELTNRLLAFVSVEVYNAYLSQITELYRPFDNTIEYNDEIFDSNHNIRYINITKWVIDKNENSLEKLVNVYEVLSNENCNIALIFNRKCDKTNVYLGVVNINNDKNNGLVNTYNERLLDAIHGNFPGSECKYDDKTNIGRLSIFDDKKYSVASISNIPAEKSDKFNTQTIEKLIDGIVPEKEEKEWTLVLLATPILDIKTRKLRVGEYYSALNPYKAWETNYTYTESMAKGGTGTVGINLGGSAGSQVGSSESVSNSGTKLAAGTLESGGIAAAGSGIGAIIGTIFAGPAGATAGSAIGSAVGTLGGLVTAIIRGDNITESLTNTITSSVSQSKGKNFGANFARSSTTTQQIGKNEGINQHFENYNIKHTLEILEEQMKRLEQSSALGLWDFAAYVLSEDSNTANNVAHSYLALTQGEKSYMSEAIVNLWRGNLGDDDIESQDAKEIIEYLKDLRHPIFGLSPDIIDKNRTFNIYPTSITATTALSGKELAYSLNFPKKSVSGLPVIECAEFGRNITTFDTVDEKAEKINIGNIYHMHHEEKNVPIELIKESLTSHTFITGSTGSGKSNTVYEILKEANDKNIKFLVVEPTKGEYKDVFGMRNDVNVYGTNPEITSLLKINPFSFEKGIHVFEHMDRLVEIFNVCWPMYAAMPAVLKNAIEKSYEDCGWDLVMSTNKYGDNLYPTFKDVARNIKEIIDSSEYDNENKGAYKGSLLTRLQSLTNGINGLIFVGHDEIESQKLFDENVILDISRVGSNETKSLIMGMVVLKLQEYRIVNHKEGNELIKHLTVLEEAHNLLKRTSTEQPVEGGNLLGKSVEMIANAIAEMRTYGEGFIIVDQAPGLLDMAAIRNTNTKIIMRLPDEMDRKLVGKAANLNDDQIIELAKLPKGVAAIYQNEWIQPVLCKIKKFTSHEGQYKYDYKNEKYTKNVDDALKIAELLSKGTKITGESELKDIKEKMKRMKLDASMQVAIINSLINPPKEPRMTKLAPIINALFPEVVEDVKKIYKETSVKEEWTMAANNALQTIIRNEIDEQVRRDIIQASITYYLYNVLFDKKVLEQWCNEGGM